MDRADRDSDLGEPIAPVSLPEPEDAPSTAMSVGEAEAAHDSAGAIRSGKLAGKSLWAAIWILSLPVLLQQTMAACVGMVDKMLAGNLPDSIAVAGLDAVGIGSYIGWFIGIAMTGLGIGGQALIARAMGAGDAPLAHRALGQAMALSLAWGAVVGAGLWLLAEPLARYCELSPEATTFTRQYVGTLALAMPFCGFMWVGSMCLHGAGETARPAVIAILVNLANIVLSWVLSGVDVSIEGRTLVNPMPIDPERFGVYGIAAGTALSYLVGAILILTVLGRGVKDLRLERRELGFERSMIFRIVRVGVPNFFEGLAMWGVNIFVLKFIGVIAVVSAAGGDPEEGLIGAHVIAVQWEAFSFLPGFAMGTAAGALAGQYLGAGNPAMARKAIIACTTVGVLIMCSLGVVFMTQGEFLTRLVSDEPIHLRHVPNLLFICGAIQFFFAVTMVVRQGLRGVGDTRWIFAITFFSSYFVRLPAAYVLGVSLGLGIEGVWIALCGELVVRACLFSGRFFHGGWQRIRI